MGTKIKTEETALDKRMNRELAAHDQWVTESEKQQRNKAHSEVKTSRKPRKTKINQK